MFLPGKSIVPEAFSPFNLLGQFIIDVVVQDSVLIKEFYELCCSSSSCAYSLTSEDFPLDKSVDLLKRVIAIR